EIIAPVRHSSAQLKPGEEPKLAGYVLTNIAEGVQEAQIQRVTVILTLVTGISMVFILTCILILVHHVFQPVRDLVAATKQISAGDLTTQVRIKRQDVFGILARCFNEMVNRIRQQQDELEDRIRQRTAQLETANQRLSSEIAEKEDFLRAVSHDLNAPLR